MKVQSDEDEAFQSAVGLLQLYSTQSPNLDFSYLSGKSV